MMQVNWKKWNWPSHWCFYYRTYDRPVYRHIRVFGPFTWEWYSYDRARIHYYSDPRIERTKDVGWR